MTDPVISHITCAAVHVHLSIGSIWTGDHSVSILTTVRTRVIFGWTVIVHVASTTSPTEEIGTHRGNGLFLQVSSSHRELKISLALNALGMLNVNDHSVGQEVRMQWMVLWDLLVQVSQHLKLRRSVPTVNLLDVGDMDGIHREEPPTLCSSIVRFQRDICRVVTFSVLH